MLEIAFYCNFPYNVSFIVPLFSIVNIALKSQAHTIIFLKGVMREKILKINIAESKSTLSVKYSKSDIASTFSVIWIDKRMLGWEGGKGK